jgi:predicted dehydrogenase
VRATDARALARIGQGRVFTMDKWRYHPGVLALARIAQERRFGPVLGIRTERLGWGSRDAHGTVWHLMPHDLAIVLEILGEVPPLRWAHVQRCGDAVTGATALLGEDPWVECRVSSHHPQRQRRVQLVCRDAVACLDDGYADALTIASGALLEGDRAPDLRREPIDTAMPLLAELTAFTDFLRGKGPAPKSDLADAVTIVERIEQVLGHGQ